VTVRGHRCRVPRNPAARRLQAIGPTEPDPREEDRPRSCATSAGWRGRSRISWSPTSHSIEAGDGVPADLPLIGDEPQDRWGGARRRS